MNYNTIYNENNLFIYILLILKCTLTLLDNPIERALDHSSRHTPSGQADSKMIFYRTLILLDERLIGIVKEITLMRQVAEVIDYRLRKIVLSRVKAYEYQIASLSSIRGKLLDKMITTNTSYSMTHNSPEKPKKGFMNLFTGKKDTESETTNQLSQNS